MGVASRRPVLTTGVDGEITARAARETIL